MIPFELDVLVIATGRYVAYASELIDSFDNKIDESQFSVRFVIFTDDCSHFSRKRVERVEIDSIEIESYGWPLATLLRYQIFQQHWESVRAPLVMYLDADTRLRDNLKLETLIRAVEDKKFCAIEHPGYFRRSRIVQFLIKTRFGPWEGRKESMAFVPVSQRRSYVCGGVWFGERKVVERLCHDLAKAVKIDQDRGLIAKFHDESHLNRWRLDHPLSTNLLEPTWAWADGYGNLKNLEPIIEVIHKPSDWKRA